jgi:hypothetical protein
LSVGSTSQKLSSSSSPFGAPAAFLPDLAVGAGGAAGFLALGGAGFGEGAGTGADFAGGLAAWGGAGFFFSSSGDERSELHALSDARGVVGFACCGCSLA